MLHVSCRGFLSPAMPLSCNICNYSIVIKTYTLPSDDSERAERCYYCKNNDDDDVRQVLWSRELLLDGPPWYSHRSSFCCTQETGTAAETDVQQ